MIAGIYATLGVFLLWASRKPEAHLSLVWFTVWSSVIHGLMMAVQVVIDPAEHRHLLGDVPGLISVTLVLGFLTPRGVVPVNERGVINQMPRIDESPALLNQDMNRSLNPLKAH